MLGYRWFQYAGLHPANNGAAFYDTGIPIKLDALAAPFMACGIETKGSGQDYTVRMRDGQQQYFQSAQIPADMLSAANLPCPVIPALRYPADGIFSYDLAGVQSETPANFWVILHGYHELQAAQMTDPGYPAKFEETPYVHTVTVVVPANTGSVNARQRVPIFLPFTAPFAIRGFNVTQLAGGIPFDVRVQLRDAAGQAFSNIDLPWSCLFAQDQPEVPVTPNPEILLPAGRSFTLDVNQYSNDGPFTFEFAFTGALLDAVA